MREHSMSGDVIRLAAGDVIRLDGVTKSYQAGAPPALADVSMGVAAGEVVAVMGPSGSGKSTLLNLIAGLDRPTADLVTVAGRRIDNLSESALARFRARHVGIIFQFFKPAGRPHRGRQRDAARPARRGVPAAGTGAGRRTAGPDGHRAAPQCLPGAAVRGQRQRVAIARALVNSPELLLADEPTGALDTATGQEIAKLLRELNHGGQTLVLVTHDRALAERYAARTVRLVDGQVAVATTGVPA